MLSLTCHSPHHQSMLNALKGNGTDRVLLVLILMSIVAAWFIIQANVAAGPAMAEVYHDNTLLATYPIPKQGEAPIHLQVAGELGLSDIVIDADGARIVFSPCSSQRCVLAGSHIHAGDMIACVPNKILISLRGSSTEAGFDAIVE